MFTQIWGERIKTIILESKQPWLVPFSTRIEMLRKLTANTVYIKVFQDRFEMRHIESRKTGFTISPKAFTTNRLLVGQFSEAEEALRNGMKGLGKSKWSLVSPVVVIHPMEKTEGGLSQVEERTFKELAMSAGARKVVVWVGHELTDSDVLLKANGK